MIVVVVMMMMILKEHLLTHVADFTFSLETGALKQEGLFPQEEMIFARRWMSQRWNQTWRIASFLAWRSANLLTWRSADLLTWRGVKHPALWWWIQNASWRRTIAKPHPCHPGLKLLVKDSKLVLHIVSVLYRTDLVFKSDDKRWSIWWGAFLSDDSFQRNLSFHVHLHFE